MLLIYSVEKQNILEYTEDNLVTNFSNVWDSIMQKNVILL